MSRAVAISLTYLWLVLGVTGSTNPVQAEALLNPDQFTGRFITTLIKEEPGLTVLNRAPLSLRIRLESQDADVLDLGNLYRQYLQNPNDIDFLVNTHLRVLRFYWQKSDKGRRIIDRIVPLIRMAESLPESIMTNGVESPIRTQDFLFENLTPDFIIVYAFDFPDSFSWLEAGELQDLGVGLDDLRNLAVDNLRTILKDRIVRRTQDGVSLFLADDNYASSLLLLGELWDKEEKSTEGPIIAIVPVRNLIVVSGSQPNEDLQTAKRIAGEAFETEPFPLSTRPLIRLNGKWESYRP